MEPSAVSHTLPLQHTHSPAADIHALVCTTDAPTHTSPLTGTQPTQGSLVALDTVGLTDA